MAVFMNEKYVFCLLLPHPTQGNRQGFAPNRDLVNISCHVGEKKRWEGVSDSVCVNIRYIAFSPHDVLRWGL